MFFNTSKIQFESKSQLLRCWPPRLFVVFQYVKDTIWKQITTISLLVKTSFELFFNTSKIQFESKSQLRHVKRNRFNRCFSIRQRYNLKANHNEKQEEQALKEVVFQYVKDTIWKQITTGDVWFYIPQRLFFNTSKIQFESKSQPIGLTGPQGDSCFSIRQRYNLKANHNPPQLAAPRFEVVFQYVKDTIWNQITTLIALNYIQPKVVFQYVKDTIWKQITTINCLHTTGVLLFFNTSKIQFESKSQLTAIIIKAFHRCFSIRQRYNLKANHNFSPCGGVSFFSVVFQYVKDTIWKQITT